MKDISHLTEQYISKTSSSLTLHEDYISLISRVGEELRYTRKIKNIEKYLTILHLIVIGNNSVSQDDKNTYLRLSQVIWDDIDE
jgi:hypothetical protein